MKHVILDDHLLRDFLADDVSAELAAILAGRVPATTNLYLYRLSKSVVASAGGRLTGAWSAEARRALGEQLLVLPEVVEVVPLRSLTFRMAEISATQRVSTLGAEAVAAAQYLGAPLCVWEGDDGPGIRAAMASRNQTYQTVAR